MLSARTHDPAGGFSYEILCTGARNLAVIGIRCAVDGLGAMNDAKDFVGHGVSSFTCQSIAGHQTSHGMGDNYDLISLDVLQDELLQQET